MSKTSKTLNLDKEIKQCAITKPYDALKSDFGKKLIEHLASDSNIGEIVYKLDNETEVLSPKEWRDFLEFMQEHKEFFDSVMMKYKGQYPARMKFDTHSNPVNMGQEDHVLYISDKWYVSLDKIKNYVRSRIKGYDPKILHEGVDKNINHYAVKEIKSGIDLSMDEGLDFYKKFMGLNYSNRINKHGVMIHNINGIMFTNMENNVERHRFKMSDMSNDLKDFSKGKSFGNLKNNPLYTKTLELSDAKAFDSLEESNAFQFKLMQTVADQLWMDVHIDIDFIDDPKNEKKMEDIMKCLYHLTGWELWIPYKFDEKGLSSSIHASEEHHIFHPDDYDLDEESDDESPLSFFLEVDPSLGKEKN